MKKNRIILIGIITAIAILLIVIAIIIYNPSKKNNNIKEEKDSGEKYFTKEEAINKATQLYGSENTVLDIKELNDKYEIEIKDKYSNKVIDKISINKKDGAVSGDKSFYSKSVEKTGE
jgi:flagellar basal body-associated protein FliL